ncbi:WYL domain-containing protein [Arthrobacter sp. H20]|uniref:helix-turn-helix transcriptional regulator n=1 Tax=Arthrobacter sp. H20 TaxID=1267981 RepID=UPI00047C24B7|nr:WYL domain-containing protein [Arthrobacter sp. H20]
MSAKRTERLLTLVMLLLSTQRGYSKDELFKEIELYCRAPTAAAREKLFDRDKAMLREQGIPVESFSDDPAFDHDNSIRRYRIDTAEYRLPAVSFSAEESAALALAAGMWDVAALDSAASRALRKLQDLGAVSADTSAFPIEPRIRTNEPHWDEVWRATTSRRVISFSYRAASTGREEQRTLQPWGMGSRYGNWYVVGRDLDRGEERYFRLSRITTTPQTLEGTFHVPDTFTMLDSLGSLDRASEPFEAVVAVRPDTCHLLRTRRGAREEESDGGWDTIRFPYGDPEETAADIAAFGPRARAVSPPDLVATVGHQLARAAATQDGPFPAIEFGVAAPRPARRKTSADAHLRRLLDLVPYLLDHPGAQMEETAVRFGVTRAQLAADLELLFVSGPRYYPDGLIEVSLDGDRIFLSNADNLAEPLRLNLDEACTLIVGLDTLRRLPGLAPGSAAATAHAKLTEAAGDAGRVGKAIATTLTEEAVGPTLETIQAALSTHMQLDLTYLVPTRDEVTRRTVEPIRAFSQDDVWYLEAWCTSARSIRNFRLDRIQDARLTADLAGARRESSGESETLFRPTADDSLITVILQPPARWVADHYHAERIHELAAGSLAAEIRVSTTQWIPGLISRLGGDAAVATPEGLRRDCVVWLAAARVNYP